MAEIVNLRMARKRRDRTRADAAAERNRAVHGRTRSEREGEAQWRERADRTLDGAHLGHDWIGGHGRDGDDA